MYFSLAKLIEPVSVHEDINPDLEGEVTSFSPKD